MAQSVALHGGMVSDGGHSAECLHLQEALCLCGTVFRCGTVVLVWSRDCKGTTRALTGLLVLLVHLLQHGATRPWPALRRPVIVRYFPWDQ